MEPKLLIHVTYQAKPGRGREFVRQIVSQGLRGKILAEDGCLTCSAPLACGPFRGRDFLFFS